MTLSTRNQKQNEGFKAITLVAFLVMHNLSNSLMNVLLIIYSLMEPSSNEIDNMTLCLNFLLIQKIIHG